MPNHSTEKVGGIKRIDTLGALKLNSVGSTTLTALDDVHQATGRNLNLMVGNKHNTIGGDMQEWIEGVRESVIELVTGYRRQKNGLDGKQ